MFGTAIHKRITNIIVYRLTCIHTFVLRGVETPPPTVRWFKPRDKFRFAKQKNLDKPKSAAYNTPIKALIGKSTIHSGLQRADVAGNAAAAGIRRTPGSRNLNRSVSLRSRRAGRPPLTGQAFIRKPMRRPKGNIGGTAGSSSSYERRTAAVFFNSEFGMRNSELFFRAETVFNSECGIIMRGVCALSVARAPYCLFIK